MRKKIIEQIENSEKKFLKKCVRRDKKKKIVMKVSGASVKKLSKIISKRNK